MRMKKISIKGLIVDPIMNSPKIRKNYVADSLGITGEILRVKEFMQSHSQTNGYPVNLYLVNL